MAERKVTETLRDQRGRILALCNPRARWSPRRSEDALRDIHFRLHRYRASGGGREAEIHAVGGRHGAYLRTDWDRATTDNLDELPPASKGNRLTGVSDIALQASEGLVEQLGRAMHRAGVTEHHAMRVEGHRCVELAIGAPESMKLLPTEEGDTYARARVELPILYRSRPIDSSGEIGDLARARLHVRARVASLATPNGVQLFIEWSETKNKDVDVAGARDERVTRDIGRWARAQGAAGQDLRLTGLSADREISELRIAFRRSRGANLIAADVSFGDSPPDRAGAANGEVFLERDWALGLSEHLVTDRIRDGLLRDLGALPPPFGPDPVALPGATDLFLDSFDVRLDDGALLFEGVLRRQGTPVVTADYIAEVKLKLSNGRVQAEVGKVKVDTREWYADLADFVSGRAVSGAIERGLRQAVGASAGGRLTTLFSGELLSQIATVGAGGTLDAEPVLERLELRRAGVVAQGKVEIADVRSDPVASFAVLPARGGPNKRILHAGGSWAPGGRLTKFKWEFGDGEREELSGARTGFVVEHDYSPGRFTPRLTVTDDRGRTASAAKAMNVA